MHTTKETTTLDSIRKRLERGIIDKVKVAFYAGEMEGNEPIFTIFERPEKIPANAQTIVAEVEYGFSINHATIKARSLFGLSMSETYGH